MRCEWEEVRLGEVIITNINSFSISEQWDFVNYLDTGNITENKIDTVQYIDLKSKEKLPSRAKRKVEINDIIYSTVRPIQKHYGIIKEHIENLLVSTGFTTITTKPQANSKFIYYFLTKNETIQNLQSLAEQSVSTYPSIKASDIENLIISLPPLKTQQKIASILSVLDDKIELNNAINKNLEEQAQALFKSWFVDFEPFGGVMPEGWGTSTLENISKDIVCGKTPPTKVKEYYGYEMPFITIPDMHNNTYVIKTERYLSKVGANIQPTKTLPFNSICVSCIATAGLVSLVAIPSQTNQQINSIIVKDDISPYYVYLLMKSLSEHIQMLGSSGSTTCNLNKGQFSKIEVLLPPYKILKRFNDVMKPIFQLIKENQYEIKHLSTLRDTLLPKLMSGELDVSEIDI